MDTKKSKKTAFINMRLKTELKKKIEELADIYSLPLIGMINFIISDWLMKNNYLHPKNKHG